MSKISMKRVSSLLKIRSEQDIREDQAEIYVLPGEHFSYQVVMESDGSMELTAQVRSPIAQYVKVYVVRDVIMDYPVNPGRSDEDFLTRQPGQMPDLLVPLSEQNGYLKVNQKPLVLWVDVCLPGGYPAGTYAIELCVCGTYRSEPIYARAEEISMRHQAQLHVLGLDIPTQKTEFTQWFHADCVAAAHHVEIYSEAHWALLDAYMAMAAELGITMLLTPVFTPSMDIKEGRERENVQLVGIKVTEDGYSYDFSRLRRWIGLCRKNGIRYLEIVPLFTQWGLKYSPVIKARKNAEEYNLFGWHVLATDPAYAAFLRDFLPKLIAVLREEEVFEFCRFHISDEPSAEHIEEYRRAHSIVKPLLEGAPVLDALSQYVYYEEGLVDIPVTPLDRRLQTFLEHDVQQQWIYYCCVQDIEVSNRFLAMPSYRNRILGLQMYKYGIKGFLQWGFNFYNSQLSLYPINPYITTSAEQAFPSGDAFSVYPWGNGVQPSLRALIFREALQDIEICRLLEKFIGKQAVVDMIEQAAGMELTFFTYPKSDDFIPNLMRSMKLRLAQYSAG